MSKDQPMTKEYFIKRLVNLCLRSGLSEFPKGNENQHILLKSALLIIGKSSTFTEKEINEKLKFWVNNISPIEKFDHITLRRMLVDAGYLSRNNDGSCYWISQLESRPNFFDDSVEEINVLEALENGREEIARRKREYIS